MIGVSRSKAEESPLPHLRRRFVTLPASSGTLLTGAGPDILHLSFPPLAESISTDWAAESSSPRLFAQKRTTLPDAIGANAWRDRSTCAMNSYDRNFSPQC